MRWDDLTYLLAVMRGGSLAKAARSLGVDKTTVSRRLATLEEVLGVTLVERDRAGRLTLTEPGRRVASRAEAMEDEARTLRADLSGDAPVPAGRVRLTAVPLVVNHLLLPHVAQVPDVALELISEARDLSLEDRDADIALRLARPRTGGQAVLARRLGSLDYGCFVRAGISDAPWIGYDPAMHYLSHAQAIEALADQPGAQRAALSVNDAETLLQAVLAGQGQSLLPRRIGARFAELTELDMPGAELPTREVWLLVRKDIRDLARIKTVVAWLEQLFAG